MRVQTADGCLGTKDFDRSDVIVFERRPIRSGTQTLTLAAATEPSFDGVDPYNKRVDRNSQDNVSAIETARRAVSRAVPAE